MTQSRSSKGNHATLSRTTKAPKGLTRMKAAGQQALSAAKRGATGAARAGSTFAKEHPVATAGVLVGAALVGAVAQHAMHHEPTLGEVVKRTVTGRAHQLSKAIRTNARRGVGAAARSMGKALR